jgi:alkylhydroperoxidase family enzyme
MLPTTRLSPWYFAGRTVRVHFIASHTASARKAGMTEAMFGELMAVVGMANETNRLANGYRVPIDAAFEK